MVCCLDTSAAKPERGFYFGAEMKQCTKCKEWKSESEYFADKRIKSGLKSYCKKCCTKQRAMYRRTEHGKETIKKWWQSENGKALKKRYHKINVEKVQRYHKTEHGKETHRQATIRYRDKHRDKIKAHNAVRLAKSMGTIPPASELQCYLCDNQAKYYHHDDYSKPLDIKPVCTQCHARIHNS